MDSGLEDAESKIGVQRKHKEPTVRKYGGRSLHKQTVFRDARRYETVRPLFDRGPQRRS